MYKSNFLVGLKVNTIFYEGDNEGFADFLAEDIGYLAVQGKPLPYTLLIDPNTCIYPTSAVKTISNEGGYRVEISG